MLLSLFIENFALIDKLDLEFGAGLNVLTGETGAGKSIILDAIDAVLGGKVSSRVIRTGSKRAMIEGTFTSNSALAAWLTEQEIDLLDENSVVVSREVTATDRSVRSRSRVNGVLVNRQFMNNLRERLVEITAQGQNALVGQSTQVRNWLDSYGGDGLMKQRSVVGAAFSRYHEAHLLLERRRTSERERLQKLDLLTYQAKELGEANLNEPNELEKLLQEQERLNHVVELQQMSYKVYEDLYQSDGGGSTATDLLGNSEATLMNMVEFDTEELQPLLELIRDAQSAVTEVARQINAYGDALEADPERLDEVEERIRELKQICRKYGPSLAEVIEHYNGIQEQLNELNDGEKTIESLEKQEQECLDKLTSECSKLTKLRSATAALLEAEIIRELKPLAMDKVQFKVELAPIAPTANGSDKVSFLFSPNPGEPLQPLSETASGGEMSRFLLALKATFSASDSPGTMVFDEIDVGVSGRVAQTIAEKLHQLSLQLQVLCVTHQPLVAAMADRHFHVNKQVINQLKGKKENNGHGEERTVVRIKALDNLTKRRDELAQLAGGKSANDAVAFADSLLAKAATHREGKEKGKGRKKKA
ncbi:DNA repair protein RecN [Calothrix parasitica NIES-267]|uniref:DNA repair protein RecN n=1 Tax=Calothrix parasitica NIES-267 TaxID=1973488 RepID=A0A1Z4LQ70_9CYAN|nr:DNA repair protein RecN [Calothrix parasitica NIES-267]